MSTFMEKIIKANSIEELKKHEITADDIKEYADYYQEILDLKNKYNNAIIGRNVIANQIIKIAESLDLFSHFISYRIKEFNNRFEKAGEYISDYEMALRLLLRLANDNGENFVLKKFKSVSDIWIIGEKTIIDKIDEKKYYFGSDYGELSSDIIKKGHSLVIMTSDVNNVAPWNYCISEIQRVTIKVCGFSSTISCYLYDDDLRTAVNKFMAFINQNGADIIGIDENQLFDVMSYGNIKYDEEQAKKLDIVKKDN